MLAGASLPKGLHLADPVVVGITVAIGAALAETKMGALFSFSAAPLALVRRGY